MIKDTSHNEGTVKLVVYVPETHADVVRRAMGEAAIKKVHPYEEITFDVYPLVLNTHKTTY